MFGRLNKFFYHMNLCLFSRDAGEVEIHFSLVSIYITCKVSKVFNKQSREASISISLLVTILSGDQKPDLDITLTD